MGVGLIPASLFMIEGIFKLKPFTIAEKSSIILLKAIRVLLSPQPPQKVVILLEVWR